MHKMFQTLFWKITIEHISLDQWSKVSLLFLLYGKLKAIEIHWNEAANHLLSPHTKLIEKTKRGLELLSPCLIFHITFEEKFSSCYILLIDQIPLSLEYWNIWNMYIAIVCKPDCDVMSFDVKHIFLIKPFFVHDQKVATKT